MFEWDEEKNRANIDKHGLDFEDVRPVFLSKEALIAKDERQNYEEERFIILCPLCGRMVHVTYTRRGEAIRIVSARRANRRERRYYEQRRHN